MESSDPASLAAAASKALKLAAEYSYGCMKDDGHWCAGLLGNPALTAEYVFLHLSMGHDFGTDPDTPALSKWLLSQQNPADGSWGLAPHYPGDASMTVEAYFALKILQVPVDDPAMIPVELILLPTYCPENVYNLSYWARVTVVPMMVVRHHEPIYALPKGAQADYLDELWIDPSKKNVPYFPPLRNSLWKADAFTVAFTVLDKTMSFLGGSEPDGDLGHTIPPMYAANLALKEEGWSVCDSAVQLLLGAVERHTTTDSMGKRLQCALSPLWDTVLMTVALVDSEHADERLDQTMQWINKSQYFGPNGDWRVNNPTLPPGSWAFQHFNTWYPDTDDTAAALLALLKGRPAMRRLVLRLPRYTVDRGDAKSRWRLDVTGHMLECYGLQVSSPYRKKLNEDLLRRMRESASRAIGFLELTQTKAGAWWGRWASNYIFGTSCVLCGLEHFTDHDPRVRPMVRRGLAWMKSVQNSDGGWGETLESYRDPDQAGVGPSSAQHTAWGVMSLLAHLPPADPHIKRGVSYLLSQQTKLDDGLPGASWPMYAHYTAIGFPLHFWLEYTLYVTISP
ncbi:unnamed protein product [Calypogeia fissa]